MTKCQQSGCRNLELRCLDCGRLVNDCKLNENAIEKAFIRIKELKKGEAHSNNAPTFEDIQEC